MNKMIDFREKIMNRSIGFNYRQIEFFNTHPEFKPDLYCRNAVDEQIRLIDTTYLPIKFNNLKNEDENYDN